MYSSMKKGCSYSHERHITRVWETAVHDYVVLLTLSLQTQSTTCVNLLLKVKWQSQDEMARRTSNLENNNQRKSTKALQVWVQFPYLQFLNFLSHYLLSVEILSEGRELSVSYVGGWAAVSRRGATNTTELWKALRSTHALSKEVWHIAPDGNLKKGKTRELHWIQSISVMNSIAEGEECNFCATGGIKRNRTTLKRLKWCLPMQNWQQRCQCVAMRLLGCSGWLLGEMHFKPPG